MLFNSFAFLAFFAGVAALYYLLPHRWRWVLLLVASYYFYSTFEPVYLLLLGFATLVAYEIGRAVEEPRRERRKLFLTLGIVAELSVLLVFKYVDFLAGSLESVLAPLALANDPIALPRMELLLPVGLSFYTFSAISYIVDVYRGKLPAERHLGKLALYVAFFPKLLAGPIERAGPFLAELAAPARFDPARVAFGLQLLLWGLFKKVVIADRLAAFVDTGFNNPGFQSPAALVVAVYLYAFQIYCDFSGYSDMAIGAAAILGIRLMENFRRPYLSRSVPEFWSQRWHISLMAWFRDYLYIPLGGNRVAKWRWYLNQMIVFLVSGLWHGANWTFVIWGGLNGMYQVVYFMTGGVRGWLSRLMPLWTWNALAVLLTFHLILVSWVFFRAESIADAWSVITRIGKALPQLPALLANYHWTGEFWLALGLIVFLLLVEVLDEFRNLWDWIAARPTPVRWGIYYGLMACLLAIGQWGMTQFVYMQF